MKRLVLFQLLLLSIIVKSQNLSLDALIHLYNLDLIETSDYLIEKGWEYSNKSTENVLEFRIKNDALLIKYDRKKNSHFEESRHRKITYCFSNKVYYSSIKSKISSYNMKKNMSGIGYLNPLEKEYSVLYVFYEGVKYKCSIRTFNKPGIFTYEVCLYKKEEWKNYDEYSLIDIANPEINYMVKYDVFKESNSILMSPGKVIKHGNPGIRTDAEKIGELGAVVVNVTVNTDGTISWENTEIDKDKSISNRTLYPIAVGAACETEFSNGMFKENGTITYFFTKKH
ncbi:MAG: hypothetical protein GQ564_16200 [Bacteroidales bacterium]|nr:hypothetical protein [Bacteroidales bacterium]